MPGHRKSSGFGYDFPLFNEKTIKKETKPPQWRPPMILISGTAKNSNSH